MKWMRSHTMPVNQGSSCQLENDAANAATIAMTKYKKVIIRYGIIWWFLYFLELLCLCAIIYCVKKFFSEVAIENNFWKTGYFAIS
jgi:hypothetical protein